MFQNFGNHLVSVVLLIFVVSTSATRFSTKAIGYAANSMLPESSGSLSGTSTIMAALSKVIAGREHEAIQDLKGAVTTMTSFILNDRFIYMIGQEAVDRIATRREFKATRVAFDNYNVALFTQLFKVGKKVDRKVTLKQMDKALYFIKQSFSDEVYKLRPNSRVMKSLKKINTWAKKEDLSEILSFAFDVISLRVNLQLLEQAIANHHPQKIAACCLGLGAGIIGLEELVAAIASEIKISDRKGMIVGSLLNVAVTLMDIHSNKNQKGTTAPMIVESKDEIENLGEHSKKQLRKLMTFISNQNIGLNDVYVVNQGVLPKWGILYSEDRGSLLFGAFGNDSSGNSPVYRREESSDIFLVAGKARRVVKAQQPAGDEEAEIVGFDFYGTFPKGYPYRGSTLFVGTDNVNRSDYRLNGIRINTCIRKPWLHPDDHLLLTDMTNLDQGEQIEAYMGKGDDVIVINGMFGPFGKVSENSLKIDLGVGLNTLSFEGMTNSRNDIQGVFFDSKDNKLSYFHGKDATLHKIGVVEKVNVMVGSPFNDYVILFGDANGNPNGVDFTVTEHFGKNFYEVNIDEIMESNAKKSFNVIDSSMKTPTIVVRTSSNITRNELVFVGSVFEVYQKKKQATQEVVVAVHVIFKNIPIIKVVDSNDNSIITDTPSNHLGPEFVSGLSLVTAAKSLITGSEKDDICVIQCILIRNKSNEASRIITVDLREGEDAIVLKDSTFFAPCWINDKDNFLTLEPNENNNGGSEEWYITVGKMKNGHSTVFVKYLLKNVERIINAFGSLIVNLANEKRSSVDLLSDYISATSHEIGLKKS